jgi:hypothetical protein
MVARFRCVCPNCGAETWVTPTEEENDALLEAQARGGIKRVYEVQATIAADPPHRCGV